MKYNGILKEQKFKKFKGCNVTRTPQSEKRKEQGLRVRDTK